MKARLRSTSSLSKRTSLFGLTGRHARTPLNVGASRWGPPTTWPTPTLLVTPRAQRTRLSIGGTWCAVGMDIGPTAFGPSVLSSDARAPNKRLKLAAPRSYGKLAFVDVRGGR